MSASAMQGGHKNGLELVLTHCADFSMVLLNAI